LRVLLLRIGAVSTGAEWTLLQLAPLHRYVTLPPLAV